ncbi:hypothetical protein PQR72_42990 [Paraburkholderia madseniana]|uniref:putative Ig domain-containing protein n=1 Tax=Paraburkholderia madseniana TaxID=2599607 RepID=UPI0015C56D4E|nr:putative Ig domain-containing protein [Paraburkholderia madseniana]NPT70836.1 hypothetical protein [Paraburkholderia madseniana]
MSESIKDNQLSPPTWPVPHSTSRWPEAHPKQSYRYQVDPSLLPTGNPTPNLTLNFSDQRASNLPGKDVYPNGLNISDAGVIWATSIIASPGVYHFKVEAVNEAGTAVCPWQWGIVVS